MNDLRPYYVISLALVFGSLTTVPAEACCKGGSPAKAPMPSGIGGGGGIGDAGRAAGAAGTAGARTAIDGAKTKLTRKEWQQKINKTFKDKKKEAQIKESKITDVELMGKIKAAIDKRYEIEEPPQVIKTATPSPVAPSPSVAPPAPPVDDATAQSRAWDQAMWNWKQRHVQKLPDGSFGLASDWNRRLVLKYAEDTGGVDLNRAWQQEEEAIGAGQKPIWRATPLPAKVPYQGQGSENDPLPPKPAGYVPP